MHSSDLGGFFAYAQTLNNLANITVLGFTLIDNDIIADIFRIPFSFAGLHLVQKDISPLLFFFGKHGKRFMQLINSLFHFVLVNILLCQIVAILFKRCACYLKERNGNKGLTNKIILLTAIMAVRSLFTLPSVSVS